MFTVPTFREQYERYQLLSAGDAPAAFASQVERAQIQLPSRLDPFPLEHFKVTHELDTAMRYRVSTRIRETVARVRTVNLGGTPMVLYLSYATQPLSPSLGARLRIYVLMHYCGFDRLIDLTDDERPSLSDNTALSVLMPDGYEDWLRQLTPGMRELMLTAFQEEHERR